jgi:hypothetical protein
MASSPTTRLFYFTEIQEYCTVLYSTTVTAPLRASTVQEVRNTGTTVACDRDRAKQRIFVHWRWGNIVLSLEMRW